MARINIGTERGNIVNYDMGKPYYKITFSDIAQVVKLKFGNEQIRIHGWAQNFKRVKKEITQ